MKRTCALPAAGALLLALAGCGGFSSGATPGLEPPGPPDFAQPENQGELKGKIEIAEGFLPELDAEIEGAGQAPHVGAAQFLQTLRVEVEGTRRRRQAEVGGDGSFTFEKLPEGDYAARLLARDKLLAAFTVPIASQQTSEATVGLLGFDHADLDADGSRRDLLVELATRIGGAGAGASRMVMPDGSVRARLANGGHEYLLPGGLVRREQPDQGASFRSDHDLDGRLDPDDVDYRRLRKKPSAPSLEAMLAGKAFPPLIRELTVSGPHGGAPGDLVLLAAALVPDLGAGVARVTGSLHAAEGGVYTFELRDDGGVEDLLPDWPGHQPSGDATAGDGIYSHLMPVDVSTRPILEGRLLVVEAIDREGRRSNRPVTFLRGLPGPTSSPAGGVAGRGGGPGPGWNKVRNLEFLGPRTGAAELAARFEAAPGLEGLVATLTGPEGFRKVFSPVPRDAGGWSTYHTLPSPRAGDGFYYVVLGLPEGRIFFAGAFLSAEGEERARTGG